MDVTDLGECRLMRRAIPNMEWVDSYVVGLALFLRTEGGQDVWGRIRMFFDNDFSARLDQEIAADTTTYVQALLR